MPNDIKFRTFRMKEELDMKLLTVLRKSLLPLVVAIALSMGVFSGVVQADGEFLTPFTPAYPELGGSYEDFILGGEVTIIPANALAPGIPPTDVTIDFPSLLDDPDILPSKDERCDTDAEGALQFTVAATRAADLLGNTICNAIPTPVGAEQTACWIAFGILQQGFHVAETFVQQCDFQDALIDGAEIQAGYENTKKLIELGTKLYEHELEDNLLNCRQTVGLILPEDQGGLAEWVEMFVQDRINQYTPIISDPDRIVTAQAELDAANIHFTAARYEDAYIGYCKAYGSLVAGKGRG
jgi:hypothetical protein